MGGEHHAGKHASCPPSPTGTRLFRPHGSLERCISPPECLSIISIPPGCLVYCFVVCHSWRYFSEHPPGNAGRPKIPLSAAHVIHRLFGPHWERTHFNTIREVIVMSVLGEKHFKKTRLETLIRRSELMLYSTTFRGRTA